MRLIHARGCAPVWSVWQIVFLFKSKVLVLRNLFSVRNVLLLCCELVKLGWHTINREHVSFVDSVKDTFNRVKDVRAVLQTVIMHVVLLSNVDDELSILRRRAFGETFDLSHRYFALDCSIILYVVNVLVGDQDLAVLL